jgi:hypothetical protein
VSEIFFIAVS